MTGRRFTLLLLLGCLLLLSACGAWNATTTTVVIEPGLTPTTVASPTAGSTPTATAAASPTSAAMPRAATPTAATGAIPVTPGTPTVRSTPGAAGGVIKSKDGACQITAPAGFQELVPGLITDGTAALILTSATTDGADFAAFVKTVPAKLAADKSLVGFVPGKETTQSDRYRLDFTAEATSNDPVPANGIFAAVPATTSGTVCIMELLYHQTDTAKYAPLVDPLIASLQATKP